MKTLQIKFTRALTLLLLAPLFAASFVSCDSKNNETETGIGSVGIIDYLEIQNRVGRPSVV